MSINISKTDNKTYLLNTSITLALPLKEIFQFFSMAENLELLTPKFLNFKITSELPLNIEQGTLIDYKIKLYGIPISWRTLIKNWDSPNQFIDMQVSGPFILWEHLHQFTTLENGSTLMIDTVRYKVPGGSLIHEIFVKKQLLKIFAYRRSMMLSIFGCD